MSGMFTQATLKRENLAFSDTPGVSHEARDSGFTPAFQDTETGQVKISCFQNGQPAPMHTLEGLPESWILKRDTASRVIAIKQSVVSGFVRAGCFYTRAQAVELILAETAGQQESQAVLK